MWSLFYYEHKNAVTQQNQTTVVEPGDIVIFAPAVRGGHAKTGEGTAFQFFTFNLPGTTPQFESIPRVIPGMERVFGDLRRASARVTDSTLPSIAFIWGLLWSVAESKAKHRTNDALYAIEAYVRQNLDRKITVRELTEKVDLSSRHILRLFRDEHNLTIQEYVRQIKVQEASRLLLNTSLPTKAIAARVGYSDLQEFNKLIRSATGASPSAFREKGRP